MLSRPLANPILLRSKSTTFAGTGGGPEISALRDATGNTALHGQHSAADGLCVIAITKASNDALLLLHAADSRIKMSIKTHLVPSNANGLAVLVSSSQPFAFFDSDRVCVD